MGRGPFGDRAYRIVGQPDGTILFTVIDEKSNKSLDFVSQPFVIRGNKPRPIALVILADDDKCWVKQLSMGNVADILPNSPGVSPIILTELVTLPGKSFQSPNAVAECQPWIDNRRLKFAATKQVRPDRQSKSIDEEAQDLRNSILRINHFLRGIREGNQFLLGTLAGELRATVYWPKGRDDKPDAQYNPILLRMASKASLPLPVYCVPDVPFPPAVPIDVRIKMDTPRIESVFPSERIYDIQSILVRTVVYITQPPKEISGRDLIKELAHTMGAAHYDAENSDFIEVMHKMISGDADQVTHYLCDLGSAVAELSEWVLSELSRLKLIA